MTGIEHQKVGADDALALLDAGNAAQRELAGVIRHALVLATANSRVSDGDRLADRGLSGLAEYPAAIAGVDAVETLASHLEASKARLITQAWVHAHDEVVDPERSPGDVIEHSDDRRAEILSREQIVGIDLATVLHVGAGCAKGKVVDAVALTRHLPHTLARLEAGQLTSFHVRRVLSAAAGLAPRQVEELDERVSGRDFPSQQVGRGRCRATTRTVTRRIDAALHAMSLQSATARKRKAGFAERRVRFGLTDEAGMTALFGYLPALHAKAIDTLLDDLARTAPAGDERTHEQRRADAFLTLFTGPAALSPAAQPEPGQQTASFDEDGHYTVIDEPQRTEAQQAWQAIRQLAAGLGMTFPDTPKANVTIDVTLDNLIASRTGTASTDTGPPGAMLRGIGPIPAHVAARLCRDADLQRIVTDPLTGQPLDVGRRHPSSRLRTAIQARDGTCRFPDCLRPAATADLDHIRPYRDDEPSNGPPQTTPANLQSLCREHHRAKHQLHWYSEMRPDGVIRWHNNLLEITAFG